MRTEKEIEVAERRIGARVWYERHLTLRERGTVSEAADAAAATIRQDLGDDELGPYSDYEWGLLSGKLSALRWVLGDEWDSLYS
jgi:hypothetical protein